MLRKGIPLIKSLGPSTFVLTADSKFEQHKRAHADPLTTTYLKHGVSTVNRRHPEWMREMRGNNWIGYGKEQLAEHGFISDEKIAKSTGKLQPLFREVAIHAAELEKKHPGDGKKFVESFAENAIQFKKIYEAAEKAVRKSDESKQEYSRYSRNLGGKRKTKRRTKRNTTYKSRHRRF